MGVSRLLRTTTLAALLGLASQTLVGCFPTLTAAVSMKVARSKKTPHDASVTIDEQYIGPLYYVARRGVRLPVGEHRITVEKTGYFPWDTLVVADREPIQLEVDMLKIPD
jgi:hypothetical protein